MDLVETVNGGGVYSRDELEGVASMGRLQCPPQAPAAPAPQLSSPSWKVGEGGAYSRAPQYAQPLSS